MNYSDLNVYSVSASWRDDRPKLWYISNFDNSKGSVRYLHKDGQLHKGCGDRGYWDTEEEAQMFLNRLIHKEAFIRERDFKV